MIGVTTVIGRAVRMLGLGAVISLVVVLATAGKTGQATTGDVIYGKLGVQDVRLSLPKAEKPKGVAIWFHGQTGGVDNRMDEPWLQALLRSGWIVASSDFHTASWGNADSTEDTRQLAEWATEQTGAKVKLFVSGSMGASVSLNAMVNGVPAPKCWYGVKPAVDILTMGKVPGAKRIIAKAYGGEVPYERNPVNRIGDLSADTRYRIVASAQDQWVPYSANAKTLKTGLESRGAEVTVLPVKGRHDDPSHFNAGDLVSFASTCS